MPTRTTILALLDRIWVPALAIGLPLLLMLLMGTDANWDLRNYHLYNPHAWLGGRDAIDVAPAQLQTWHNPLLDVPIYLITMSGADSRWGGAWLVLPTIASLLLLFRLLEALGPRPPTRTSQAVLALLAVSGASAGSTLGLSMNDAFVGAAILASLVLLVEQRDDLLGRHRWFFAGLIAGAMAGLKLTTIFYCFGLAAAALADGAWQQRLRRLLALGLGGALGFALTYGYWGWRMFRQFGNPFFPYYNNLFKSAQVLPQDWADARFRVDSFADALLSPLQLLVRSREFSEITLSDPRLLLGLLGLLGLWLLHRRAKDVLRGRFAALLAFFVVSWLMWAMQYGIYRYAIVLELLGCLALVIVLQHLPRARNIALLAAFVLVSADTKRPNWGHVRSTVPMAGIVAPDIPADSLVVIASQEPLAYVGLGLPREVPLISVWNNMMSPGRCMGLQATAKSRIGSHTGPLWLLQSHEGDGSQGQSVVDAYLGLVVAGECKQVESAIGGASLCPLRRVRAGAAGC